MPSKASYKYTTYIATFIAIISIFSVVYLRNNYESRITEMNSRISDLQKSITNLQRARTNLTLVDDQGYVLNLTSYPNRIVSLSPSNTEILFKVGAGDKVVAVTDYCNYPYNFTAWIKAGNMTSVGGYTTPNIEVIVSLKPDLIVAALDQDKVVDTLRGMGLKVLVLDPDNIGGVLSDIALVGRATNKDVESAAVVSDLRHLIDAVVSKVAYSTSKPKVYYEVWYDPLWSTGSESWENGLIEKAGGINIFADQRINYFEPSSEAIVQYNPDMIIFPLSHGAGNPYWGSFSQVKERPGWGTISALKHDRLYTIDADIMSRPGPRIVDALEILVKIIHPELFH